MRQTATLSGDKVDWPMPTFAAPAVPKIAGTRKMWGSARLPKGHELPGIESRSGGEPIAGAELKVTLPGPVGHDSDELSQVQLGVVSPIP